MNDTTGLKILAAPAAALPRTTSGSTCCFYYFLASIAITVLGTSARAGEFDPKIHKLCIEAKDYIGFVRAMKGDTAPTGARVINSQGADIAEGNQCPSTFAYVGGGNCQQVTFTYGSGGNDWRLGGLKDLFGSDVWYSEPGIFGGFVLRVAGPLVRASVNSSCSAGEPKIGYNSTCQTNPIPDKLDKGFYTK